MYELFFSFLNTSSRKFQFPHTYSTIPTPLILQLGHLLSSLLSQCHSEQKMSSDHFHLSSTVNHKGGKKRDEKLVCIVIQLIFTIRLLMATLWIKFANYNPG